MPRQQTESIAPSARLSAVADIAKVAPVQPLAVSAQTAAELLSISERSLFELVAPRGPIRAVRLGSRRLFAITELNRWLAEATAAATQRKDDS